MGYEKDFFDRIVKKISAYDQITLIMLSTLVSTGMSIPLVYLFVSLFEEPYTSTHFYLSVILPLSITPFIINFILKLAKHLQQELEENKKKDIILFEQARFALMGEMLANISHQWKQPLNTIALSIVAARTSDYDSEKMDKYFEIMETNTSYLASTIDDFLSFFDKRVSQELRELPDIFKEVGSITGSHIKNKGIELMLYMDETSCKIKVLSSLSQVLINLLNNARDAFEGIAKEDKIITVTYHTDDEGLTIICCDNGRGVDEEIRSKVFDAYFTTKHKKQGTGIGLYMSKEIIHKVFEGEITLQVREGETCFEVFIPYGENCVPPEDRK